MKNNDANAKKINGTTTAPIIAVALVSAVLLLFGALVVIAATTTTIAKPASAASPSGKDWVMKEGVDSAGAQPPECRVDYNPGPTSGYDKKKKPGIMAWEWLEEDAYGQKQSAPKAGDKSMGWYDNKACKTPQACTGIKIGTYDKDQTYSPPACACLLTPDDMEQIDQLTEDDCEDTRCVGYEDELLKTLKHSEVFTKLIDLSKTEWWTKLDDKDYQKKMGSDALKLFVTGGRTSLEEKGIPYVEILNKSLNAAVIGKAQEYAGLFSQYKTGYRFVTGFGGERFSATKYYQPCAYWIGSYPDQTLWVEDVECRKGDEGGFKSKDDCVKYYTNKGTPKDEIERGCCDPENPEESIGTYEDFIFQQCNESVIYAALMNLTIYTSPQNLVLDQTFSVFGSTNASAMLVAEQKIRLLRIVETINDNVGKMSAITASSVQSSTSWNPTTLATAQSDTIWNIFKSAPTELGKVLLALAPHTEFNPLYADIVDQMNTKVSDVQLQALIQLANVTYPEKTLAYARLIVYPSSYPPYDISLVVLDSIFNIMDHNAAIENETKSSTTAAPPAPTPATPATGEEMAAFAKTYLGAPYQWGGDCGCNGLRWSPKGFNPDTCATAAKCKSTEGTDCSGFVHLVYAHFGMYLAPYSGTICSDSRGKKITNWRDIEAGDVLCKEGHVGLYAGNNKVVEEAGEAYGCILSDFTPSNWLWGMHFDGVTGATGGTKERADNGIIPLTRENIIENILDRIIRTRYVDSYDFIPKDDATLDEGLRSHRYVEQMVMTTILSGMPVTQEQAWGDYKSSFLSEFPFSEYPVWRAGLTGQIKEALINPEDSGLTKVSCVGGGSGTTSVSGGFCTGADLASAKFPADCAAAKDTLISEYEKSNLADCSIDIFTLVGQGIGESGCNSIQGGGIWQDICNCCEGSGCGGADCHTKCSIEEQAKSLINAHMVPACNAVIKAKLDIEPVDKAALVLFAHNRGIGSLMKAIEYIKAGKNTFEAMTQACLFYFSSSICVDGNSGLGQGYPVRLLFATGFAKTVCTNAGGKWDTGGPITGCTSGCGASAASSASASSSSSSSFSAAPPTTTTEDAASSASFESTSSEVDSIASALAASPSRAPDSTCECKSPPFDCSHITGLPSATYQTRYEKGKGLGDGSKTYKELVEAAAAKYCVDPVIIVAHLVKESSMGANDGCWQSAGKSAATGCGWPGSCAANCGCSNPWTGSQGAQIACTADLDSGAIKQAIDGAQQGNDIISAGLYTPCHSQFHNELDRWLCMFCRYQSGNFETGCTYNQGATSMENEYCMWKNYYDKNGGSPCGGGSCEGGGLSGKKIYLDAGHGDRSGIYACQGNCNGNKCEAEETEKVVNKVTECLEAAGAEVLTSFDGPPKNDCRGYTLGDQLRIPTVDRGGDALKKKADAFVSVHFDSPGQEGTLTEIYCNCYDAPVHDSAEPWRGCPSHGAHCDETKPGYAYEESNKLAKIIYKHLHTDVKLPESTFSKAMDTDNDGVIGAGNALVEDAKGIPATLIETVGLDKASDKLNEDAAKAICDGIIEYFGGGTCNENACNGATIPDTQWVRTIKFDEDFVVITNYTNLTSTVGGCKNYDETTISESAGTKYDLTDVAECDASTGGTVNDPEDPDGGMNQKEVWDACCLETEWRCDPDAGPATLECGNPPSTSDSCSNCPKCEPLMVGTGCPSYGGQPIDHSGIPGWEDTQSHHVPGSHDPPKYTCTKTCCTPKLYCKTWDTINLFKQACEREEWLDNCCAGYIPACIETANCDNSCSHEQAKCNPLGFYSDWMATTTVEDTKSKQMVYDPAGKIIEEPFRFTFTSQFRVLGIEHPYIQGLPDANLDGLADLTDETLNGILSGDIGDTFTEPPRGWYADKSLIQPAANAKEITNQYMVDENNCGGSGIKCTTGQFCVKGVCVDNPPCVPVLYNAAEKDHEDSMINVVYLKNDDDYKATDAQFEKDIQTQFMPELLKDTDAYAKHKDKFNLWIYRGSYDFTCQTDPVYGGCNIAKAPKLPADYVAAALAGTCPALDSKVAAFLHKCSCRDFTIPNPQDKWFMAWTSYKNVQCHELGHAVFGLTDEYDFHGGATSVQETKYLPNVWESNHESACKTAKKSACISFEQPQGTNWWKFENKCMMNRQDVPGVQFCDACVKRIDWMADNCYIPFPDTTCADAFEAV